MEIVRFIFKLANELVDMKRTKTSIYNAEQISKKHGFRISCQFARRWLHVEPRRRRRAVVRDRLRLRIQPRLEGRFRRPEVGPEEVTPPRRA